MILQALNNFYENRKEEMPPFGFSSERIDVAIVLSRNGEPLQIKSISTKDEQKYFYVPSLTETDARSSGKVANFLWDNSKYVLGVDAKGKDSKSHFKIFYEFQKEIGEGLSDEGMEAVLKFLEQLSVTKLKQLEYWEEIENKKQDRNVAFILEGTTGFIHDRPKIKEKWLMSCPKREILYSRQFDGKKKYKPEKEISGICLVSGKKEILARVHRKMSGVWGGKTTGNSIVSFNNDAYISYNKDQNFNSPISITTAFNYTSALNFLLRFESKQKIQIGDATTVFWTEKPSPVEGFMGMLFDPKEDSGLIQDLKLFLDASKKGERLPKVEDSSVPFYILGLSPNASRISVRFWHVSTIDEISKKLSQHFKDLSIIKEWDNDPDYPPLWRLLVQTALEGKSNNVAPLIAGAMMRSILTGSDYPQTLLARVLERIRAEQSRKDKNGRDINNVNYYRAAILKACLVRKSRLHNKPEWEVKMSLDKENNQPAYRLGRLFCVLEKVQKDAIPGANSTIKDRFYGSASTTPAVVFPRLIKNAQHHIQKAEYGGVREKLMEEILNPVKVFPVRLSLEEQGLFALGYYHQKKDLYTKKDQE